MSIAGHIAACVSEEIIAGLRRAGECVVAALAVARHLTTRLAVDSSDGLECARESGRKGIVAALRKIKNAAKRITGKSVGGGAALGEDVVAAPGMIEHAAAGVADQNIVGRIAGEDVI